MQPVALLRTQLPRAARSPCSRRLLLAVFPLLAVLFLPGALAQDAAPQQPVFLARAEALRFAFATEVLGIRLQALASGTPAEEEAGTSGEDEEEDETGIAPLQLFAGSLGQTDPALLRQLTAALEAVEDASSAEAEERAEAARNAGSLLARARDALVPDGLRDDPAFRAALIVQLALSEAGPGEGYEEAAAGEEGAFRLGWTSLQRIEELWAELAPMLTTNSTDKVVQALHVLDELLPSSEPPARFRDPEDAEVAVQDLAFGLEAATGETLFPHDFAASLALAESEARMACSSVEGGKIQIALERAAATSAAYGQQLANTMAFIMPELHQEIAAHLEKLPQLIDSGRDAGEECAELQDALARAGGP